MRWSRLSYGRTLALITAIGAVLRFAFIARQSLGYDEDFTAVVVHLSAVTTGGGGGGGF
jgi:hypothetical protein